METYNNDKFTSVKQVCDECGKSIAVYLDGNVTDWDAAPICKNCFKEYKEKVKMLMEQLTSGRRKLDIYDEYH